VNTLSNLAGLHAQQGRLEEARQLWERALEVDPRHVDMLCELGLLHFEQDRPEEARRLWERALEVDRRHVPTLHSLGQLHAQNFRPEKARRLFERALEVDPRHVATLCERAALYLQQNRSEEARPLLERALEADPRHVNSLYYLGQLHLQGRPDEARRLWERAMAIEPGNTRVQASLGMHAWRWTEATHDRGRAGDVGAGPGGGHPMRRMEAARAPPLPTLAAGAAVVLGGLAQRPELNGRQGVVRGFDAAAGRCPPPAPPPARLLAPRGQRSRRASNCGGPCATCYT
jgi:tetratricopeptide (TPR) repeat protein